MKVICIVEGDGEVAALPILLRRIAQQYTPSVFPELPKPIRVRRDRFLRRDDEFRRHLLLAAGQCGQDGWILVLLDADDDCPVDLSVEIVQRARECVPHRAVSVVVASREYEAWLIAAAASLHGYRGFECVPDDAVDPDRLRNAKGWIKARMGGAGYGEMTDLPAFTARMDVEQAYHRSRSFRKLCTEWCRRTSASTQPE